MPDARVEVVPNGVDIESHQPYDGPREAGTIVFTGLRSYYPNQHGVRLFIDEVLPRAVQEVPGARLLVVGADPPAALDRRGDRRVVVTGYVPDVRPYLRRAQAYVVPLRIGGGTRVKVLQAMAMRVPIVSTSVGCEGLDIEHGRHALVADDPAAFARAVVRVLREPALRATLTRHASEHVGRFGWPGIGDRLEAAFAAAARTRPRRAVPALTHAADPH